MNFLRAFFIGLLFLFQLSCSPLKLDELDPEKKINLVVIVSDPYFSPWSEWLVGLMINPIFNDYRQVFVLSGDEAHLNRIAEVVHSISKEKFDLILMGHGDEKAHFLLPDENGIPRSITSNELARAVGSEQLRFFYTSVCHGRVFLNEMRKSLRAQFFVGHEATVMVPVLPFFAVDFFYWIHRGLAPESASQVTWDRFNGNWFFRNVLIPLNEVNSGVPFSESAPVVEKLRN